MNIFPFLMHKLPFSSPVKSLLQQASHFRFRMTLTVLLIFAGAAISSAKFALIERLLQAGSEGAMTQVAWLVAATAVCWGVAQLLLVMSSYFSLKLNRLVGGKVIAKALHDLLDRSISRVKPLEANLAVHYLRLGLRTASSSLKNVFSAITQFVILLFSFVVAFWLQPILAGVSVLSALIALRLATRHIGDQRASADEVRNATQYLQLKLYQLFEALPQIKIYGAGDHQLERICTPLERLKRGDQELLQSRRQATLEVSLLSVLGTLVLLGFGVVLLRWEWATTSQVTACILLHQMLFMGLRQILRHWSAAEENSLFLANLLAPPAEDSVSEGKPLSEPIKSIECRQAKFLVGDTVLISGVTCRLQRGKLYGIVGPSGSGKTMLLQMLNGTSRLGSGRMLINGQDLAELDLEDLSRGIALVVWPPLLLEGISLADNLRIARPECSDEELLIALQKVAFEGDLEQLQPLGGLEVKLGREGVRLSVGQLQRLALARVLLRAADVLLIDDLLSGLDPFSTSRVLNSLRQFAKDHLVVIVASTGFALNQCDEILVMEKGRLITQGPLSQIDAHSEAGRILYSSIHRAA